MKKADELWGRVEAARLFYSPMLNSFKTKREYALLEYPVPVPDEIPLHRSLTPASKVARAANQIVTDMPRFDVTLPHEYKEIDERRRDKQLHMAKLLFSESEKQNRIPPLRDCAMHMAMYGAYCMSIWWREDWHAKQQWPFQIRAHNPETIIPISDYEFAEYLKVRVMDVMEMVAQFNAGRKFNVVDWKVSDHLDPTELLDVVKYYSPDERCIWISGVPIFTNYEDEHGVWAENGVQVNAYGYCPYVWGTTQWGNTSPDCNPKEEARGVNDLSFDAYQQESFMLSHIYAHLAVNVIQRQIQRRGANVERGETLWDVTLVDDLQNDLMFAQQGKIDQEVYNLLGMLRTQINENTVGESLEGKQQGQSGAQEAMLMSADMKTFRAPRSSLEIGIEKIWQKAFYLAKENGPVYYWDKHLISPSDIIMPVCMKVSLEPMDMVKQQAQILMLKELYVAGTISWETFAIQSGIVEDITNEKRLLLVNDIMRDPAVKQIFGQKAVEAWGIQEQLAAMNEIRKSKGMPEMQGLHGENANQAMTQNMMGQTAEGQATPPFRQNAPTQEQVQ